MIEGLLIVTNIRSNVAKSTGIHKDGVREVGGHFLNVVTVVKRVGDNWVETLVGKVAKCPFSLGTWRHVLNQREVRNDPIGEHPVGPIESNLAP